jgi:hypothetical protein
MHKEEKFFVIGLPQSGKTTFLAALWHVVDIHDVPEALQLVKLEGDRAYLNFIRSKWSDVETLERTKVQDEKIVSMLLADKDGDTSLVWIPDLSGESLEAQWTDRVAPTSYVEFIRECSGGMLFIHPAFRKENLISEIEQLIPQDEQEEASETTVAASEAWDPKNAPTQVQLVDILQSLCTITDMRPIRLAVTISAWDLINPKVPPKDWLEINMPLLFQYLMNHQDDFVLTYFGISAQGGDHDVAAQVKLMQEKTIPSQRIQVTGDKDYRHDITAPIRWLRKQSQGNNS